MGSEENGNRNAIDMMSVPPQNVDAERAVLGALMQAGDNEEPYFEIQSNISQNSFYRKAHRDIFSACASLVESHDPVDLISVTAELEKSNGLESIGGVSYLDELIESCPTTANIKFYAEQVREAAVRRYLIRECAKIAAMADDTSNDIEDVVEKTEAAIMTIRENNGNNHLIGIKDATQAMLKRVQTLFDNDESIIGLPTGFHRLDMKLSGMQPGQYIIVAGRPGMGKSTFIQNVIKSVSVDNGGGVALFTLETSWESFTMRLFSQVSQMDFQALRTGHVTDWPEFVKATAVISEAPLWLDDSGGIKPSEIRGKLRQVQRDIPVKLIIVDYLQLMQADGRNEGRRLEIESISAMLKALAQEFKCPLIACSQLSRRVEERPDKRPMLSDLRESGALEQDADVVLFLYRGWYYDKKINPKNTELIIAKHKDGPTGKIYLNFDLGTMTFTEVDTHTNERRE